MSNKRIYYGKKSDGKQNSWTGIPDWVTRKNYLTPPQQVIYELILVNSVGFGKMKYHKKVFFNELAKQKGMTPRATSRALYELKDFGLIDFKYKNGAKIMIEVKDLLPTFWEGDFEPTKCDKDTGKSEKDTTKCEKVSTPPRSKELVKEVIKELPEDSFLKFERAWFLTDKSCELLNSWLVKKFDRYKTEQAFNSLSPEQQNEAILSLKYYLPRMAHHQTSDDNPKYMKQAHDYISLEEYIPYYKPIKDEIFKEKKDLERNLRLKKADENKATPEERKEALFSSFKRKENNG